MKHGKFAFSILVVFSLIAGCKKNKVEPYSFTKTYDTREFTVDSNSVTGTFLIADYIEETDIIQTLGDKGFSVYNLQTASLNGAKLDVVSANRDLNCFTQLELRIGSSQTGSVAIATAALPDENNETSVVFTSDDVELKDVFHLPELEITVNATTDLPVQPTPLRLKLDLSFDLSARLDD
ncbi:MAG: hypothetical protein R2850_10555 [Bacteroidia bacterium]